MFRGHSGLSAKVGIVKVAVRHCFNLLCGYGAFQRSLAQHLEVLSQNRTRRELFAEKGGGVAITTLI
jgi:hypothetical protein